MKFTQLTIENFMSIRKTSLNLDNQGLVLIQGKNTDEDAFDSNGAGKSAIFSEAPCWCLFGQTIRGLKADGVINRTAGKNTKVSLAIIADNGDEYVVTRHRKHKEHNNNVILTKNGTNITGRSDKETNNMIESLIQMDYLTFTNSIMFGQGLSKMFASSTDGEQKKILEQILQIDLFKACQDEAKARLSSLDDDKKDRENDIAMFEGQKDNLEETIQSLEKQEKELAAQVEKRIQELNEEQQEYDKELAKLDDLEDLNEVLNTQAEDIEKCEEELKEYDVFSKYQVELLGLQSSLEKNISSIKTSIEKLEKQLNDLQTGQNVPNVCDKCGQPLPLNDTSTIENHLKDDIEEEKQELIKTEKELEDSSNLLDSVNTELEGKKTLEEKKQTLQKGLSSIESDIRFVIQQEKSIGRAQETIAKAIEEQEKLLGTTYTHLIEDNKKKVEDLIEKITETSEILENIEKDYELYNFWVNAFGNQGIKSILLDSVTPYLNQRANHYLARVADSSIEVQFNTQTTLKSGEKRDRFSIDVVNKSGDTTYHGNSGGEKRRIDIAVSMALQDLVQSRSSNSIDLVVYDEAFENLDGIGCENVVEILQEKATTCRSVIVITHNDELKQLFNKNIVVEKVSGETKVQYID